MSRVCCPNCGTRVDVPLPKPDVAGITPLQLRFLTAFAGLADAKGFAPSYEELRVAMGFRSRSQVHWIVMQLEERGHIRRAHKRARSLVLVRRAA